MKTILFSLLTSLAICSSKLINITNSTLQTVKDCSSGSTIGHIQTISMDPSAPVAGQEVVVTIDYTLDSLVTGGNAQYTASYNGFPLSPTTQALCPDLETSTPCPIAAGNVHYEGIVKMGDDTTHGTVSATTTWLNQDNIEILCWSFTVRI